MAANIPPGMIGRREMVAALLGLLAGPHARAVAGPRGRAVPFSWAILRDRALALSRRPYAPPAPASDLVRKISYATLGDIFYRPEKTLWREHDDASAVRFFPLTKMAPMPVSIAVVEDGLARPFAYSPSLYKTPDGHPLGALGEAGGFSGFRIMNRGGIGDWLAFQGASYFRSAGPLHQYGLSARGIAIDTGLAKPEEFPAFTHFWLERGATGVITVYALLEGPSITGAFRFVNRREADEMAQDVSMVIHLRRSVERLGIAPLTSMFWYAEGNRRSAGDWRPEIHDSDGLAIETGRGERIWRPLINPPRPQVNSFADAAPRGFGLLQRDRAFDHYQDDAVFYEKRPSLWVEPQGDWGAGAVMLYEIPTRSEYDDNIVAFWQPRASHAAGSRYAHDYRLRWIGGEPAQMPVAGVVNCWTGPGGLPGQPPRPGATKLVIDFAGDRFAGLTYRSAVEPVVNVANGTLLNQGCYPVNALRNCWRLVLDIERGNAEPGDIRAFLSLEGDAITETLLYQLF